MRCAMTVRPHGRITDVEIRVTLTNPVPGGEPSYIAGPAEGGEGPPGRYIGLLAASVPGNAGRLGIDTLSEYAAAGRDGTTLVVAAPVTVDPGESKEFMVHFQLARSHDLLHVVPSARVPAVPWSASTKKFADAESRVVSW